LKGEIMSVKSERVKYWRQNTKTRMIDAFGGKCGICGYDRCCDVFDLHHLDPTQKEFGFGNKRSNIISWERMCVELRKCVLLCANCHREVHSGLKEIPENIVRFNEEYANYKLKERKALFDSCPICGVEKRNHLITCSRKCAAKRAGRFNWESLDVVYLVDNTKLSYSHIANLIGCSDVAVRKRYLKLKNFIP